jgi:acyl-coenzyme A synthetase/AMP-(fatty) acid ligase
VFAGFSAEALSQRILDCKPNFVLTTSGVRRGSKVIKLKEIVDDALERVLKEGFAVGNCHPPSPIHHAFANKKEMSSSKYLYIFSSRV